MDLGNNDKIQEASPPAGSPTAKLCFVIGTESIDDHSRGVPYSDATGMMLSRILARKAVNLGSAYIVSIFPPGADYQYRGRYITKALESLKEFSGNLIVPVGTQALKLICGDKYDSVYKWQLSFIPAIKGLNFKKCMPMLDPAMVNKVFKDYPYLDVAATRIAEEMHTPEIPRVSEQFTIIDPTKDSSVAEIMMWLDTHGACDPMSVDIETSFGQINTVGFAVSPSRAIAIPTLISNYRNPHEFHGVWQRIVRVLEGPSRKIFQNFIFDVSYFARYGIKVSNIWHDTMLAQKFIYPELKMGLDNVARIWTKRPYWKDDASDWTRILNWHAHYVYNCKDTTATYEATEAQLAFMSGSGQKQFFQEYIMALTAPVQEMCMRGLPLDEVALAKMKEETTMRLAELYSTFQSRSVAIIGKETNPRSPAQVKALIKATGATVLSKDGKETSDKKALKALAIKHPDEQLFPLLLDISKLNKLKSSYLDISYDADKRVRFSMNTHGTETGRFSCHKDAFDRGLNAQTLPKEVKKIFVSPEGSKFIQVDLAQAEARFVAWDCPEPKLIEMYMSGIDIHKFVAARILGKPEAEITKLERQLGKKIGHGSNYGMAPQTFAVTCLDELGVQIDKWKAEELLNGYHSLFPGIRNWHEKIKSQLRITRSLETPIGRKRLFFDRLNDDMFRQAYAYRPQSTIPDIINHLMLKLFGTVPILLQCHDSLLLEVPLALIDETVAKIRDIPSWHPKLLLDGGELVLPVEIEIGQCLGEMKVI